MTRSCHSIGSQLKLVDRTDRGSQSVVFDIEFYWTGSGLAE